MLFENVTFQKARFIKSARPFVREFEMTCIAPMLRKSFSVASYKKAELRVCALGYGEFYLNGKPVTADKLIAPVSNYEKTLWVTAYDVTDQLNEGENLFAAVLGNGFYNEPFPTSWDYDAAPWRDQPKLIAELCLDGVPVLWTDEGWKCKPDSAIIYNHLRSGEYFDARKHIPGWNDLGLDDSDWETAVLDDTPPRGQLRLCVCPPIRECDFFPAVSVQKTGDSRWLFDIGQNISGYVRLKVHEPAGTEITIRYAEEIEFVDLLQRHLTTHYQKSPFMTDKFISDGNEWTWSPRFTYHGFQYIEVSGLTQEPTLETVGGVFLHQDVKPLTEFHSDDERLNKLWHITRMAIYSNLFYMPTDCPTREKLGWCNDAQSSCDFLMTHYDMHDFFRKWLQDIFDAMRDDGMLPGIVPTSGWGYQWGNGPVSEGILFEIPYQLLNHYGDDSALKEALPYFKRSLDFFETQREEDGLIHYGLNDWAPPTPNQISKTPASIINEILIIKFLRIAALAEERFGGDEHYAQRAEAAVKFFQKTFLNEDGSCKIRTMTTAAMILRHDLYTDFEVTKKELMDQVEEYNFHHDCGMVGMPCLFPALEKCGLDDWGLRILTADGYPGYMYWIDHGATTLWETWKCTDSHNHHMYSSGLYPLNKLTTPVK